jgi:hypothetical protein
VDERIRVSDADRERVTARLREHFAEGRLTSEELDERISAALSAKTAGELRRVMVDLPEPQPAGGQGGPPPGWGGPGWAGPGWGRQSQAGWGPPWAGYRRFRRGPRVLPLLLILLILAVVLPGAGWVFFAFLKIALLLWLVACVAGILAAARFRRHVRRQWQSGQGPRWHQNWHHQNHQDHQDWQV